MKSLIVQCEGIANKLTEIIQEVTSSINIIALLLLLFWPFHSLISSYEKILSPFRGNKKLVVVLLCPKLKKM